MRVAIDAHMVGEQETGNESYVLNLLRGLGADSEEDSIQVLTPHPKRIAAAVKLPRDFRVVRVWPSLSILRIPLGIPVALLRQRTELLHATYILPPRAPCPMVVTVHDLSFFALPDTLSRRARLVLQWLVPVSVRSAKRVIAISEFTRDDLVRYCQIRPEQIRVTYLAPDDAYRPIDGPRDKFVLAVGNLEPRKNLNRLIEAFTYLVRQRGFEGQLVLAGKEARSTRKLTQQLLDSGMQHRVEFTGYVSKERLRSLYNRAAVFVFPSLYEGFGLPALEAMACGCPTVVSNVTALPEVVGDSAIKVDPHSAKQIADGIEAVATRPELAADLRERGLRRARLFSWRKTAEQTRAVYREAVGIGSP